MQNDETDARLRTRLAELMSSGGLGYNQISQEILFLLPDSFVSAYIELWESALGSAGSGDARGQQLTRDANLGKATVPGKYKGARIGAGAGGQGKKWKRMGFQIKNEEALNYKGRIDRRLRALAREMVTYNAIGESSLGGGAGRDGQERKPARCPRCGKIMEASWIYCPSDGSRIERP